MLRLITFENLIEVNQLVQIDQSVFGIQNAWNTDNFTSERSAKSRLSFLLESEGMIHGYIVAYQSGNDVVHVSRLAVGVPFQNQGIAYQLIKELVSTAAKGGYKRLTVEHPQNTSLQDFYQKNGFTKLSEAEVYSYVERMEKKDASAYFGESPQRLVYAMEL